LIDDIAGARRGPVEFDRGVLFQLLEANRGE
jgi:hypothetical protein